MLLAALTMGFIADVTPAVADPVLTMTPGTLAFGKQLVGAKSDWRGLAFGLRHRR